MSANIHTELILSGPCPACNDHHWMLWWVVDKGLEVRACPECNADGKKKPPVWDALRKKVDIVREHPDDVYADEMFANGKDDA